MKLTDSITLVPANGTTWLTECCSLLECCYIIVDSGAGGVLDGGATC